MNQPEHQRRSYYIPLILLPGWKVPIEKYNNLVDALRNAGLTVHGIPMPGFPDGPKLQKIFTMEDYCAYTLKCIRQLKLDRYAILGHSFGGRIALQLAPDHPEIQYLILTGTPGYRSSSMKRRTIGLMTKTGKLIFKVPGLTFAEHTAKHMLYRLIRQADYMHTSGYLRETFKNVISVDLHMYMKKIHQKVLLVWGKNDQMVSTEIAEKMSRTIQHADVHIIPGYGHNLPYFNEPLLITSIMSFINNAV